MTKELDQTNLALAVLTASLVKALEPTNPGLSQRFRDVLSESYSTVRDWPRENIGTLEVLRWTGETLDALK